MTTGKKRTGHQWTRPADYDFNKMPAMELEDGTYVCARPPTGWECTREPGHDGPCAAIPVVDTKPKHIDCESYTDYQPGFGLYKEQRELIQKWMKEHDQAKHIPAGKKYRYSGAIGGAYTYKFTGTSIGTVVTVHCACGEAIDVSDYDQW